MIRHKLNRTLIVVAVLIASACAGKLAPNASPEAQAKFKKLQVVSALSDFQDGVIAANHAEWLDDKTAVITVTAVQVGLDVIEVAPDPKAVALKVLEDIGKQANNPKLVPYLNSAKAVVEAL